MGNRREDGVHSRYTAVGDRPPWGPAEGRHGVPDEGHRLIDVPMGSHGQGSISTASGTTLGVQGTSKMKENERFYGFTDFRGKPAGRGVVFT